MLTVEPAYGECMQVSLDGEPIGKYHRNSDGTCLYIVNGDAYEARSQSAAIVSILIYNNLLTSETLGCEVLH